MTAQEKEIKRLAELLGFAHRQYMEDYLGEPKIKEGIPLEIYETVKKYGTDIPKRYR